MIVRSGVWRSGTHKDADGFVWIRGLVCAMRDHFRPAGGRFLGRPTAKRNKTQSVPTFGGCVLRTLLAPTAQRDTGAGGLVGCLGIFGVSSLRGNEGNRWGVGVLGALREWSSDWKSGAHSVGGFWDACGFWSIDSAYCRKCTFLTIRRFFCGKFYASSSQVFPGNLRQELELFH